MEEKKKKSVKYYEIKVFDKNDKLCDRTRLKSYPDEWGIRNMIEMVGGAYCTITDFYRVEPVKEPFINLADVAKDMDKWLQYKIWNPNMKDCIPYEGSIEYPYNRLGVISLIKIASYNGLLIVFNSDNEKAADWANHYAWEYNCSPCDFSGEEKEPDDDFFY